MARKPRSHGLGRKKSCANLRAFSLMVCFNWGDQWFIMEKYVELEAEAPAESADSLGLAHANGFVATYVTPNIIAESSIFSPIKLQF